MAVEKRNALASKASFYVPEAISDLNSAKRYIQEQNPDEAMEWIAKAQGRLDNLRQALADACAERASEEGVHLGED